MSSKQNDRHIIWSDIHLDFEDWRADLEEQYPDLSEDELIQKMYEINSEYLGDERMNLNVQLSQPILVVADIGRWDGRYDGYAEIKTGNIKDCLYSEMDMCEWYVDNGRLYHEILSKSYLTAFRYTESELLEILNLERSTFYDRKKEAVMLLGIALWGYAIPVFRGIFDVEGDESEIPEFFTGTEKSDPCPTKVR